MHILYIITSFNGGTGRVLCNLANALVKNHQVTICELRVSEDSLRSQLAQSINMVSFRWANGSRLSTLFRCLKFIRKCNPKIIHGFDFAGHLFGFLSGKVLNRLAVVVSVHGLVGGFVGWRRWVQRFLFCCVDHIHCVSSAAQTKVEELIGKNTNKITVIANGINLNQFRPVPRGGTGDSEGKFVIGCVADFFGEVKGQHFLIEAMTLLRGHIPNVELWLIGDGKLKSACEKIASQRGVNKCIKFWGHRKDVPDLLKQMDVFVMPSLSESFGLALVEAMATGIPVIGSDVGGISDIITNEKTGLLVSAGQPGDIADKVVLLYHNVDWRQELAEAGRLWVVSRFTLEAMVEGYTCIYSKFQN